MLDCNKAQIKKNFFDSFALFHYTRHIPKYVCGKFLYLYGLSRYFLNHNLFQDKNTVACSIPYDNNVTSDLMITSFVSSTDYLNTLLVLHRNTWITS